MLRKNFCFFRLSLFLTNGNSYNCAELQHKMAKTAAENHSKHHCGLFLYFVCCYIDFVIDFKLFRIL